MKQLIIITVLAFAVVYGNAQVPIKAPTKPTRTAAPAKPKPTKHDARPTSSKISEETVTKGDVIDLGLSVKWASHNVGAYSPEECGNYYGWADPSGNKTSADVADYPSTNPPKVICGTSYDIAQKNWGGTWRMPSIKELKELVSQCNHKVIHLNGISGMKFISKKNGRSIFLPFAGDRWGIVRSQGLIGCYWSGTLYESNSSYACYLYIDIKRKLSPLYYDYRYDEYSVRPVTP